MTLPVAARRVLIMAGGTGGHIFPALSIARCLQQQGATVEWLGTRAGLEYDVVPPTGIPLHLVNIRGLRGKGLFSKLLGPLRIVHAIWQSLGYMRRHQPDCVLGMGGFVSGPGGVAAWLARIPLVVHEQNAIAGFTNLVLLPFSTVAMEAFPGAYQRKRALSGALIRSCLPGKNRTAEHVGNPVRREISDLPVRSACPAGVRIRLLVLGGSLGAQALNNIIPLVLAGLAPEEQPEVIHQCGKRNLDATLSAYDSAGISLDDSVRVTAFIEDMAQAYAWADLVICRSGALTIAELAAAGVASVLVPYPHAVDDHQTENAGYLVNHGAARLVPQNSLGLESLLRLLRELFSSPSLLLEMAVRARALAMPEADSMAASLCLEVANG